MLSVHYLFLKHDCIPDIHDSPHYNHLTSLSPEITVEDQQSIFDKCFDWISQRKVAIDEKYLINDEMTTDYQFCSENQ